MSDGGSGSVVGGMAVVGTDRGTVSKSVFFFLMCIVSLVCTTANAQSLRVMKLGLGEGRVIGTGIDCGVDCNETFAITTDVELRAVAEPGSRFIRWGGDCSRSEVICSEAVSSVSSVRAEFGLSTEIPPLTEFTPEKIAEYLSANLSVNTPARFIEALPLEFRQNWILMVRSESLQTGTAISPRILLPSADSRRVFTIGMTQHSSYPGSHPNAIEYMQWDEEQKNFRFHEIVLDDIPDLGDVVDSGPPAVYRFPGRPRKDPMDGPGAPDNPVSIDDPKCFACHSTRNVLNRGGTPATDGIPPGSVGHKSKPNWDTYDSWAGMLAFNRDRIYQGSIEAAAFRNIFNLWTWQTNDNVRSVIERLALQPPGVPAAHIITRNTGGGVNDGHISFPFDEGTIVAQEPMPAGTPDRQQSSNYAFDGTVGSGSATEFARGGRFVTLHHSRLAECFGFGCSPTSDEGRGVDLFDELFGVLNPIRVADEVVNHRFITGSIPFDIKPMALAVAGGCINVSGGTDVAAMQRITTSPALSPTALSALTFFNQRHGISNFDELYDDTQLRQNYLTRRKADIQKIVLDRTIDPYAYDLDVSESPPPPPIIEGLVQAYGADTELFNADSPLSDVELLERFRREIFRRLPSIADQDSTHMGGIYVDREASSTAARMALYRYFLEPLGVSIDKWSIAVRGRSRTYTMADVFMEIYNNELAGSLKPALGLTDSGLESTCNQVMPMVESSLALLPPASGMPTYTDIQRIFNKSCIECHGGLGYPPYHSHVHSTGLDFSENEDPPADERRMTRSYDMAASSTGLILNRITGFEPGPPHLYNPLDTDESCPYGIMPCGGPPLSSADIETFRRWSLGSPDPTYSEGDPHIRTIDGTHYDFQAAGEFTALRDEGMELQVRQSPVTTAVPLPHDAHTGLSTCASINTAVALRVGPHRVSYLPNPNEDDEGDGEWTSGRLVLLIDGEEVNLTEPEIRFPSGGRILRTSVLDGLRIEYPGGTVVVITPGYWALHDVDFLNVDVQRARASAGIMGSIAPGNWLPALSDGEHLGPRPLDLEERYHDLYERFASSWRVTESSSLFEYHSGLSHEDYVDADWPRFGTDICEAEQQPDGPLNDSVPDSLSVEEAREICSNVRDEIRQANCIVDVAATGEPAFAKTYLLTEKIQNNAEPSVPLLTTPDNFSEVSSDTVSFKWGASTDRDGDPLSYRHCLWTTDRTYTLDDCREVPGLFNTVANLQPGTSYLWKVITEDSQGAQVESLTRKILVRE